MASADTLTRSAVPIALRVTAPDVPPPVSPAPATPREISPTSAGVYHSNPPEPSAARNACPDAPTAAGMVKVYDEEIVDGA